MVSMDSRIHLFKVLWYEPPQIVPNVPLFGCYYMKNSLHSRWWMGTSSVTILMVESSSQILIATVREISKNWQKWQSSVITDHSLYQSLFHISHAFTMKSLNTDLSSLIIFARGLSSLSSVIIYFSSTEVISLQLDPYVSILPQLLLLIGQGSLQGRLVLWKMCRTRITQHKKPLLFLCDHSCVESQ